MSLRGREAAPVPVSFHDVNLLAEDVPANARRLAQEAVAHGWRVRCTFSRADYSHGQGVELLAVRLSGPGRAVALWSRSAGDTAWGWWGGICESRTFGYRELRQAVVQHGRAVA